MGIIDGVAVGMAVGVIVGVEVGLLLVTNLTLFAPISDM